MPKSALSPRLLDASNWVGTDDDVWYMRWRIKLKYMFAYGPRATEFWAKWREYPKTLFACFGKGSVRFETETWERDSASELVIVDDTVTTIINKDFGNYYLSLIQYYCRWNFAVQWPFHIQFHFYFKQKDVPRPGESRGNLDNKLFFFRAGARRDGDKVYWFPSVFIGLTWN